MKTLLCTTFAYGAMILALSAQATDGDQNTPPTLAAWQAAELAKGDPIRWYQEDVTVADRLRTIHKETAAALQENMGACRNGPAGERAGCIKEAREIYRREMVGALDRALTGL